MSNTVSPNDNKALVTSFYHRLWNRWELDLAEVLLDDNIRFRGSIGTECRGRQGFIEYANTIRQGFPDFSNTIDTLIAEDDRVAAQLTFRGTHLGAILGYAPSGNRIEYAGSAFFTIANQRITRLWVLGDLNRLLQQLQD